VRNATRQAGTKRHTALFGQRRTHSAFGIGCLLAGLFLSGGAAAQDAEAPGYLPPHNPAHDYLDAIDRIEENYGPYATELSDLYLGLGQTLLDRGDYEEARDAFNRGVMVVRVNSGPNSAQQTNHLYLIANIETLLGNFETADDVLHNIYFINAEQYGEDSPEMLPVIERMYSWYQTMRPSGSDGLEYADYERNIEMADRMMTITEAADGLEAPARVEAYRRFGEAQFQAVRYLLGQDLALAMDSYVVVSSRSLDSSGVVKISIDEHYDAGRRAFRDYLEAIAANPSLTPPEVAQAFADIGDWYLAIGKSRNAREHYRQAYETLAASEEYAELAENYMAQPRPVYFFNPPPDFLGDTENPLPEMNLDISMTVTSYGDARYVEVLNAPENVPEDVLGDITRLVRETPFRPAVKAGKTVTTRDFIWQFAIIPQGSAS
jgi:tetratricopeptide (TPR) repeat protein